MIIIKKKRTIIIIYQENKDKEDIIINKEIDNLYNKKGINIYRVFNQNDIDETIEKFAEMIVFDEDQKSIKIKLNKYINY